MILLYLTLLSLASCLFCCTHGSHGWRYVVISTVLPDLPPNELDALGLGVGIANGNGETGFSAVGGGVACRVTKFPVSRSTLGGPGNDPLSSINSEPETSTFTDSSA